MKKIISYPWTVEKQTEVGINEFIIWGGEHGRHMTVCTVDEDDYWDEPEGTAEYNARIIAQAPVMLHICKKVKRALERMMREDFDLEVQGVSDVLIELTDNCKFVVGKINEQEVI